MAVMLHVQVLSRDRLLPLAQLLPWLPPLLPLSRPAHSPA
jgi:hypothetical protein